MSQNAAEFELEVFFDGDCPLCAREIAMLRRWDTQRRIRFTDIVGLDFSDGKPERSFEQLMAKMHGRLPDGTWIEGVEVFRRLYAAVGFRRSVAVSRWPGITQFLDLVYVLFARHRLRLTGRCKAGVCRVPASAPAGQANGPIAFHAGEGFNRRGRGVR